jgi:tRNA-2-methylthio-N6-dimethylallyladenosine synthase
VNSYRYEGADFADLLEMVSRVDGIERIRFTSPHPKDFPRRLLEVMAKNPKVCKHIHLPLQAGNDRILELMNRTYTQKEFLDLVKEIRDLIPDVALSTDVIVGFPTETDAEFEDTVRVMEAVEFDSAFIFKYSERPGTIAARKFPDDVPEEKKTERIVRLNELQKEISLRKNRAHIGQIQEVLIEQERTRKSPHDFQGRTDGNKIVIFPAGEYRRGEFVQVRITDATAHVLKGEVVKVGRKG